MKPLEKLLSECYSKKRYSTLSFADSVLKTAQEERPEKKLRVYGCSVCFGYHLTSKPVRRSYGNTSL